MTQTAAQLPVHHSYHADRCKNCHEATDRDFLNSYGECRECATRNFVDYMESHPHAHRTEIMAEGRRSGLSDNQIKLIISIHHLNWREQ